MGRKKKYAAEAATAEGGESVETQVKDGPSPKAPKTAKVGDQSATTSSLSEKINQFREFFEQSKVEIKKVTWPTRKETVSTGVAVLILTVVMAVYLGLVDIALSRLVSFLLS